MGSVEKNVKEILKKSKGIVVIDGINTIREAGLNGVLAEHIAYDIEEKYGYSSDEIATSSFLTRRVEMFFDYYRTIILGPKKIKATPTIECVAKLQKAGKVDYIISRMVYSMYQKAGCKNIIEVNGSVENNECPACKKIFSADYIQKSSGIPVCDKCKIPLRPGFSLIGEVIDNGKITQATNAVEGADVVIVLGAALNSQVCSNLIKYYKGNKLILVNTKESFGDEKADYKIYGNLQEIMMKITDF